MIYKTAYDTFVCQPFVMTKVRHALDAVYHTGQLQMIPRSSAMMLQGGSHLANEVPAFAHPLQVEKAVAGQGEPPVVVDVRAFGKFDSHVGGFVVRNRTEYDFQILRARLTNCWVKDAPSLLLNVGALGMKLFAAWIAENVAKKFALDAREKLVLQIYSAFFYWSLFQDDHQMNASQKHRAMATILKSTGLAAKEVTEVVEHFEKPIYGVEEFCTTAQEVVRSIRLKEFNVGVLFAIMKGTWYSSNNGQEMVAVALEHPPTWIAMICMASQDRSFKNTAVNRLLENLDRRDKGVTFTRAVNVALDAAQA